MGTVIEEAVGIERISDLALSLPAEDRALLVERLHDSLLSADEKRIQDAWLKLAARRVEEARAGVVELIDAKDVFDPERVRLRK